MRYLHKFKECIVIFVPRCFIIINPTMSSRYKNNLIPERIIYDVTPNKSIGVWRDFMLLLFQTPLALLIHKHMHLFVLTFICLSSLIQTKRKY